MKNRDPNPPRRGALLVGTSKRAAQRDRERDRKFDSMVELKLQSVRLAQIRIQAEQREADREIARMKIEQRERLREQRDMLARQRQEDEDFDRMMAERLEKSRERTERYKAEMDAMTAAKKQREERETALAEEVRRLINGEWTPSE